MHKLLTPSPRIRQWLALAALVAAPAAHAGGVYFSVNVDAPVIPVGRMVATVSNAPAVIWQQVAPVVYAPQPVYVQPAPRVVYAPAPVVYEPQPVVYQPRYCPPREHHHHERGGWGAGPVAYVPPAMYVPRGERGGWRDEGRGQWRSEWRGGRD